jgi:hypothetical protein
MVRVLAATESQLRPPGLDACPTAGLEGVWEGAVGRLAAEGSSVGELYAYIYHRFGRECGSVGKILHDHRVVWGTYRDASVFVENFVHFNRKRAETTPVVLQFQWENDGPFWTGRATTATPTQTTSSSAAPHQYHIVTEEEVEQQPPLRRF